MGDAKKVERHSARDIVDAGAAQGRAAAPSPELEGKWQTVQSRLKTQLGPQTFNSWLSSMRVISLREGRLTLSAPTTYRRNHIVAQYQERIRMLWRQVDPNVQTVEIIVDPAAQGATRHVSPDKRPPAFHRRRSPRSLMAWANRRSARACRRGPSTSLRTPSPIHSSRSIASSSAAQTGWRSPRPSASPRSRPEITTPFYLYSPSGFGKTHLVSAIGREAMRLNPGNQSRLRSGGKSS